MATPANSAQPPAPPATTPRPVTAAARFRGSVPLPVLMGSVVVASMLVLAAGRDATLVAQELDQKLEQLRDDFSFVAACNIGSESMAEEDIARLQRIGARTWQRQFNDRLGLSSAELSQLQAIPVDPLPATEYLLADKPHHKVPWGSRRPPITSAWMARGIRDGSMPRN